MNVNGSDIGAPLTASSRNLGRARVSKVQSPSCQEPNVLRSVLLAAALSTVAGCSIAPRAQESRYTETTPSCVSSTASRIPSKDCAAPGRAYSGEDIQRTGAPTTADALRMLDPSITVSR